MPQLLSPAPPLFQTDLAPEVAAPPLDCVKPSAGCKPEDPCPRSWAPWFKASCAAKLLCVLGKLYSPLWALVCSCVQ